MITNRKGTTACSLPSNHAGTVLTTDITGPPLHHQALHLRNNSFSNNKFRAGGASGRSHSSATTTGSSSSSCSSNGTTRTTTKRIILLVVCIIASLLGTWFWYLWQLISSGQGQLFHGRIWRLQRKRQHLHQNPFCSFRRYANHRFYHLNRQQLLLEQKNNNMATTTTTAAVPPLQMPDFLSSSSTEYIYGAWPVLLEEHETPTKLCVDQSEWLSNSAHPVQQSLLKWKDHFRYNNDNINNNMLNQQLQLLLPFDTTRAKPPPPRLVWPFADGTNPSILLMERLLAQAPSVANMILKEHPETQYIVTICMTNSQCAWKDVITNSNGEVGASSTASIIKSKPRTNMGAATTTTTTANSPGSMFDLPDLEQVQPDTLRTVLQFLDEQFTPLTETTVFLRRDAPWGKRLKTKVDKDNDPDAFYLPGLDDARLFVYQSQIYVSFREGSGFGYDAQVLNPVHLSFPKLTKNNRSVRNTKRAWTATILASESSTFCCGRNMALIPDFKDLTLSRGRSDPALLYALTWVDPVTVEVVDTTPVHLREFAQNKNKQQKERPSQRLQRHRSRRLLNSELTWPEPIDQIKDTPLFTHTSRLLKEEKKHKSHIHGTNAFMVPLPQLNQKGTSVEFLGVAHFHRPNDRNTNDYARFGHHYTHAFYTVSAASNESSFRLAELSAEFVLPAKHKPDDAEIIQFVSGLEYNPVTKQVLLAYGINDCEGAVTTLDLATVRAMLKAVPIGKEVVNCMFPFKAAET